MTGVGAELTPGLGEAQLDADLLSALSEIADGRAAPAAKLSAEKLDVCAWWGMYGRGVALHALLAVQARDGEDHRAAGPKFQLGRTLPFIYRSEPPSTPTTSQRPIAHCKTELAQSTGQAEILTGRAMRSETWPIAGSWPGPEKSHFSVTRGRKW